MTIRSIIVNLLTVMGLGLIPVIAQASQQSAPRNVTTRNLIMLLESGSVESSLGDNTFLQQTFNAALKQNASAILVGGSVLQAWLNSPEKNKNKIKAQYKAKEEQDKEKREVAQKKIRDKAAPLLLRHRFNPFEIESIQKLERELNAQREKLKQDLEVDKQRHEFDQKHNIEKADLLFKADAQHCAITMKAHESNAKIIAVWMKQTDAQRALAFAGVKRAAKLKFKDNNREKQQQLARLDKKQKNEQNTREQARDENQVKLDIIENDLELLKGVRIAFEENAHLLDVYQPIDESDLNDEKIKLMLQSYHIMECVGADHYLFIPKFWPSKHITSSFMIRDASILRPLTINQMKEQVKGWGVSSLHKSAYNCVKKVGSYVDQARQVMRGLRKVNVEKLKTIFVPESEGWLLFVSGHGWFSNAKLKGFDIGIGRKNAGLSLDGYNNLLKFVGTTIRTKALYSSSCFGGGSHLQQSIVFLNGLKLHNKDFKPYIYLNGALTDGIVSSDGNYDFLTFFNDLAHYCQLHEQEANESQTTRRKKDKKLKNALRAVRGCDLLSSTHYFEPGMADSRVVNIDGAFNTIKDRSIKAVKMEPVQEGILVYPEVSDCTLSFADYDPSWYCDDEECDGDCGYDSPAPLFVSMLPGKAVHRFAGLDASPSGHAIDTILRDSFFHFVQASKKTFIFDAVRALNSIASGLPIKTLGQTQTIDFEGVIIEKDMQELGNGELQLIGAAYVKIAGKPEYYKAFFTKKSKKSKISNMSLPQDNANKTGKMAPCCLADEEEQASEDACVCMDCALEPIKFQAIAQAEYDAVRARYGLPALQAAVKSNPKLQQHSAALVTAVAAQGIKNATAMAQSNGDQKDHKHSA